MKKKQPENTLTATGKKPLTKSVKDSIACYGIVIAAYVVIEILLSGGHINSSMKGLLIPICAYIVMALSLNLTVGILGELSLGHAGFMSVGAFSGVVAAISLQGAIASTPLRLAVSMLIAAGCAAIAGLLVGIPVLRLNGDYLAIVTLAFGEIIKNLINCLYLGHDTNGLHIAFLKTSDALNLENGGKVIINGPMGVSGIPKLSTFTAGFILILITLFIILNLVHSRQGRAIMAIRDNRIAAESVGIGVTRYKLMAFVTSAALAGASGALYAMNFTTVVSSKFNFFTSIIVLVYVVLGGLGNMWGSIISAALLTLLPELLRKFGNYRMLIYAIVLIVVMIVSNNANFKAFFTRLFSKKNAGDTPAHGGNGKEDGANE